MASLSVHYVSGEVMPQLNAIQLLFDSDDLYTPNRVVLSVADINPFLLLLLVLAGQAKHVHGLENSSRTFDERVVPADAVGLYEGQDGGVVLRFEVGLASVALAIPQTTAEGLGRSMLTMSASRS